MEYVLLITGMPLTRRHRYQIGRWERCFGLLGWHVINRTHIEHLRLFTIGWITGAKTRNLDAAILVEKDIAGLDITM